MVLDLKNVYGSAWNIFKKSWWQYLLVTFILMFCMFIPYIGSLLQFFFMLLVLNAALKGARDEEVTFSSFFDFKKVFTLKALIFVILFAIYSFVMQLGSNTITLAIILAIVGILISIVLYPIMCVIIDKDLGIKDTIVYAASLTKGVRFEIIAIMILNLFIGFLGVILLVIGVFVALPIVIASTAVVYNILEQNKSSVAE